MPTHFTIYEDEAIYAAAEMREWSFQEPFGTEQGGDQRADGGSGEPVDSDRIVALCLL